MKRWKKLAGGAVLAGLIFGLLVTPAYAASRKKIGSVNLTIKSDILPETKYGDEEIDVEVRSGKCSFDYYDIENVGFEWVEDDVPEITIYLRAEEGYYFTVTKASEVRITGATYVKASKQDSSETLALRVKLPALAESVGDQGEVTMMDSGYAVWDRVRGAGSYEVRLYRNGLGIGASMLNTTETTYDFRTMITRAGSYHVRVRPVNQINPDNKGEAAESSVINISAEQVQAIRSGNTSYVAPTQGEWVQDATGWWYRHTDGGYTTNNWELIRDQWYFFGPNGYMKTGWIEWNGKLYYCDANTGAMLKNVTTPDGYILDYDGTRKSQ